MSRLILFILLSIFFTRQILAKDSFRLDADQYKSSGSGHPSAGKFKLSGQDKGNGNLVVTAYHENDIGLYGKFIDYSEFRKKGAMAPFMFVVGLDGIPAKATIGKVKYDDKERFIDPMVVNIAVKQSASVAIEIPYWTVPGYGKVWLTADNAGKGYSFGSPGEVQLINLNYELAKSILFVLAERLEMYSKDVELPVKYKNGIESAIAKLGQINNESKELIRAQTSDKLLADMLRLSDDLEMEYARERIKVVRKGGIKIRIVDNEGRAVNGADVHLKQVGHDFLFGSVQSFGFLTKGDAYQIDDVFSALKKAGINHYTASLFWDQVEKEKEKYTFEDWERGIGVPQAQCAHGVVALDVFDVGVNHAHIAQAMMVGAGSKGCHAIHERLDRNHPDRGVLRSLPNCVVAVSRADLQPHFPDMAVK